MERAQKGIGVFVLGSVEAARDGTPLPLGSGQQRALLAMLALARGQVVPSDVLLDALWRGSPPPSASGTLQSYVSRLRRALGDRELLVSEPGGYRLAVDPAQIDAVRFEALAADGRRALGEGRHPEAIRLLGTALALWRGPAYAEFVYESWAGNEANRLEGLRAAARADSLEAGLALGSHAELVPDLERLVAEQPLDERVRAQLALALYRCGRQADALEVIRQTRVVLRDELGIDPSPPLRRLESQILNQDPELDWAPVAAAPSPPPRSPARTPASPTPVELAQERAIGVDAGGAPFTGRSRELGVLVEALETAVAGHGRIVLVEGEAGIGKSRLTLEAGREARARGGAFLFGACFEGEGAPSLWPWLPILRSAAALVPEEERLLLGAPELAQLLPELALPGERPAPEGDTRFRLYEQAIELLARAARRQPLLLVLDDAHWADAASMHLFELLAPRVVDLPILALVTVREGAPSNPALADARGSVSRHPWVSHLPLSGLEVEAVAELVGSVGAFTPHRSLVLAIHARTEGNPFFVHELVRFLRDEGLLDEERRALYTGIPAGVRDVVARRLEALPDETRSTLELAACFGREFSLALLARAEACEPESCLERLEPALDARLVFKANGVGAYRFSHGIVRESIVSQLTPPHRARLHKRAAEALLAGGAAGDDVVEIVAEHLWQAVDIVDPATTLPVLVRASEVALSRAAYGSSETMLRRALELAGAGEQALELQLQLTSLQMMTLGYSAPEVLEGFERTADLARSAGNLGEVLRALHGLGSGLAVAGRFIEAREVAERALAVALELGDPLSETVGRHICGVANFHLGRIAEARSELRAAAAAWERAQREGSSAFDHAMPPSIYVPAFAALVEYLAGDPDEARRLRTGMLASAAAVGSPFSHQVSTFFSAWLSAFEGDGAATIAYVEEGARRVGDAVFPVFAAAAPCLEAWARGLDGDAAAAAAMDEHLAVMAGIDARTMHHFLLGLKADVLAAQGAREEALAALDAGLAESEARGEAYWRPELLRRRGELLLAAGRRGEAVAALQLAEETAAAQGAVALELRALDSLAAGAAMGG